VLWTALALIALLVTVAVFDTTVPIFHVVWLVIPLANLIRHRDADRVGFRSLTWNRFLRTAVAAGLTYGVLLLLIEPWMGVYDRLLSLALEGPDPTFAWLVRIDGPGRWLLLAVFSGLVTLYSEELFFRGWLLQFLTRRIRPWSAVIGQALIFTLFQSIPAFFFDPLSALLYLTVYAFGLGIIVGTVAYRTESIWPGLAVVTVANLILSLLLV
jgi:membrane protease YdiL (CAAX protease family)